MLIRAEEAKDREAVRAVNLVAFETALEADLVDALRDQTRPLISLVAEVAGEIVGHILFSPISIEDHAETKLMAIGPMAVIPEQQRKGIGSALVRAGLERCRELECGAVFVLGHPEYYPRFGFMRSSSFGIGCEYDVPEEVFMAMELRPGSLHGSGGTAKYHSAFGAAG